ncbi:DeoR/GlpR family DNA-binding transcription regulator [Domibacillus robiginosus]|uniref:DeoR/GlpR family DNA-binding transcription regulator n=1 Tax=Domibacillus robiginosus TaxID=1071054 RepID=UPI00067A9DC6|nr:DeoR/GlpR family DNA-binding transcription regulator [Domibacillus robiginosus]
MTKQERLNKILKIIHHFKTVSVNDLSSQLGVSEVTIRKDLGNLEKNGMIIRSHGIASTLSEGLVPSFFTRERIEMDEKHYISQAAAALIKDGESVLIDSGTTPLIVAKFLKDKKISVVTNSIPVSMELANFNGTIAVTGGVLLFSSMALCGPDTENYLDNIKVNKLILGASGIHLDSGPATSSSIEASVKQKMIKTAQEVILVLDHTKFSKISVSLISSFSDIDVIVTSSKAPKEAVEALKKQGVNVIVVDLDKVLINNQIIERAK